VLITRPEPDCAALAADLARLGHESLIEPLLIVKPLPCDWALLGAAQGLIATSRNGLRALAASGCMETVRGLPLFAVGEGTAQEAERLGFADIRIAGGSGEDLARLIERSWPPDRPLLHVAGEHTAFPIAASLCEAAFVVETLNVYVMQARPAFSEAARRALASSSLDAVILMSPRTARIYAVLCGKHGLTGEAARVTAYCLSANVAESLERRFAAPVRIASAPSKEALLVFFSQSAEECHCGTKLKT
jgi:uroporphyrinogen-III synthase